MYFSKIEKEGNDLLLHIPDDILVLMGLSEGDEIQIELNEEKSIVITKKQKKEI